MASKHNRPANTNLGNKKEKNEFLKNHPILYVIFAIIAFTCGNYLFDIIGQLF